MENKTQQPQQPVAQGQTLQVAEQQKNISEDVLARINQFQEEGSLRLPTDYSAENALKSAWLVLQDTQTADKKPVLEACKRGSIATALLDMVIQGLSVSKKQGYFIAYGPNLTFSRSYFGSVALAKRVGGIKKEPVANVVYEGDIFEYLIDPATGLKKIVKHEQKLGNINNEKIVGAYAVTVRLDDTTEVEVMSMAQIRAAWNQGATRGNSPAHKNFTDQMCKKTVIGRACKMVINSSDDSWLYDGKKDEFDTDDAAESRNEATRQMAGKKRLAFEDIPFEEVPHTGPEAAKPEDTEPITSPGTKPENPQAGKGLFQEPTADGPGF